MGLSLIDLRGLRRIGQRRGDRIQGSTMGLSLIGLRVRHRIGRHPDVLTRDLTTRQSRTSRRSRDPSPTDRRRSEPARAPMMGHGPIDHRPTGRDREDLDRALTADRSPAALDPTGRHREDRGHGHPEGLNQADRPTARIRGNRRRASLVRESEMTVERGRADPAELPYHRGGGPVFRSAAA